MTHQYRKKRKIYNEPGQAHFLTFSCYKRLPLLQADRTKNWLLGSLNHARAKHRMSLLAYVIMPEHVHLLVRPRETAYDIGRFLYNVKRPVSKMARRFLVQNKFDNWLEKLTERRGKKNIFHFWLGGGGFDENVSLKDELAPIAEYIHSNPVRRQLADQPTNWVWSSARFWQGDRNVPLLMDPIDF